MGRKGAGYNVGDENLVTTERYIDVELKKGVNLPSKLLLGGRSVRVSYYLV